jgi:hypothetical protein
MSGERQPDAGIWARRVGRGSIRHLIERRRDGEGQLKPSDAALSPSRTEENQPRQQT